MAGKPFYTNCFVRSTFMSEYHQRWAQVPLVVHLPVVGNPCSTVPYCAVPKGRLCVCTRTHIETLSGVVSECGNCDHNCITAKCCATSVYVIQKQYLYSTVIITVAWMHYSAESSWIPVVCTDCFVQHRYQTYCLAPPFHCRSRMSIKKNH